MNSLIRVARHWLATISAASMALALALPNIGWADAPGRVARLSEFAGEVQLANERDGWQPIVRNYAVTAGDNLWVSEGGRAELDVGTLQVWLAGGSNVYFERFDDQNLVARVLQGALAVRVRQLDAQDALRVLTPQGEIALTQPGLYIVNAGDGYAPATLSVRDGEAQIVTGGTSQWANRGDNLLFDGNGVRFEQYLPGVRGGFEAWALARDRRNDRWESRSAGSTSPWMVGARELDEYGSWDSHYEYGRIWYPTTVASGWAPYRYGRWAWVKPWGWTWVDDAPWGFAPSHYGRWVRIGSRWAWSPGAYAERPVYAPALVTFFGGNGWSVNVSSGPTYSWVPLGWNEPFAPWYSYSPNYWRHVNRPHVRNVAEDPWRPPVYVHARVPGAITAVAGAAFIAGRPVSQHYIRNIAERDLRNAPVARMSDLAPQFQARAAVPDSGRIRALPQVMVNPTVSGGATRQPVTERATERAVAPVPVTPIAPVVQPRVWQDPNPVVNRQPAATFTQPQAPANARRERMIEPAVTERINPARTLPPANPVQATVERRSAQPMPVPDRAVAAPAPPVAAPAVVAPRAVVEQRASPAVVVPPPVVSDKQREKVRAETGRNREKDKDKDRAQRE